MNEPVQPQTVEEASAIVTTPTASTPADLDPISMVRDAWPNPPEADRVAMWFYDIESLHNIFTVSMYRPDSNRLILFYLCDDEEITARLDVEQARQHIMAKNPYLVRPGHEINPRDIVILDLHQDVNHKLLCWMLGLAHVADVNLTKSQPEFSLVHDTTNDADAEQRKTRFAFMADTHPDFDFTKHWMIAGYNSNEYDMTMMANYFHEMEQVAFGEFSWMQELRDQYAEDLKELNTRTHTEHDINELNDHYNQLCFKHQESSMFHPTTAKRLREFNDELFATDRMSMYLDRDDPRTTTRRAMLNSGRHLDVAMLNEKAKYVGLKRLCGMLGFQIFESEKLSGPNAFVETTQDVYDLLAYNASDTINLYRLFRHPLYSNAFDLKASLIHLYPESVFKNHTGKPSDEDDQKPKIASDNVNPWRLRIDSTSAQIVAKMLAPYKGLTDMPVVSFMYPDEKVVAAKKAMGVDIERINVLDYVRDRFREVVQDEEARRRLDDALAFYRNIEGKNFNASTNWDGTPVYGDAYQLNEIPKTKLNLPYFRKDGSQTSCYVTFSTGGIHGAELNTPYAVRKEMEVRRKIEQIKRVKAEFPDATAMRKLCGQQPWLDEEGRQKINDKGKPLLTKDMPLFDEDGQPVLTDSNHPAKHSTKYIQLSDGEMVLASSVLVSGSTKMHSEYRDTTMPNSTQLFIDKEVYDPETGTEIVQNVPNKEFTFTSVAPTIHEDFTSYYPSLLTNMAAFFNPALGGDRYVAMYDRKNELGVLKEQMEVAGDMVKYEAYDILQKGTKLGLNSASGAADSNTGRQIRMNNTIISMRIIGQLFTWWIAQAQVFEGGDVVSTNTDGVYVKMDMDKAAEILEVEQVPIQVVIEPEEVLLVSKDSNNRLEIKPNKGVDPTTTLLDSTNSHIDGASGGTLACYKGPNPGNSLAHAAVLDYVLAHYLSELAFLKNNAVRTMTMPTLTINDPFDEAHARRFIDGLLGHPIVTPETALPWSPPKEFSTTYALTMFQTMVTASRGSMSYPFAVKTYETDGETIKDYDILQDFNRVFFVQADADTGGYQKYSLLKASAAKIPPAALDKLKASKAKPVHGNKDSDPVHARVANHVLTSKGFTSALALPSKRKEKASASSIITADRELKVTRINGVDPTYTCIIVNEDIECMDESRAQMILDALDLDVYLELARSTFENNWRNVEV